MKRLAATIVVVGLAIGGTISRAQENLDRAFKNAMNTEMVDGNLKAAIEDYRRIVAQAASNRALAAQALLRMAECYQKLGDADARAVFERVVRDFGDQAEAVKVARARLGGLEAPRVAGASPATRQVWAGPGVDSMGGPSPDGRYLSFTDWETGDLAIRDLAGGVSRRLTDTKGWVASGDYASESVFSPDGQQVTYAWFVEKQGMSQFQLRIVAASGGASRIVLSSSREYTAPFAWAPDGKSIYVWRSNQGATQIGVVTVADGSYRSIKSLEWRSPQRLALSPDGRFIAYDAPAGANGSPRDIFILATGGSSETIVQGPANDFAPLWSPDGKLVVFLSDRTGGNALWSMPVEAGRAHGAAAMVRADVGPILPLGMTRSGALYYGLNGRARQNIHVATIESNGAAGSPAIAIETFINANTGPAWSPDGQDPAYYSYRQSKTGAPLLVVRADKTGEERTVALPASWVTPFNHSPRWFPDNRSVLIVLRDPQGTGSAFHRLSLETGEVELLHRIRRGMSSFDLSRDGTTIVWAYQNGGGEDDSGVASGSLMRYDIGSRREAELRRGEWFITVAISPDGRQLAYVKSIRENTTEYPSAIEVIPMAGGPAREVRREAVGFGGSRYNALTWSSDQQHLYFAKEQGRGNVLWRVPANGGEPVQVLAMPARIKSPAMHHDGRRLLFAAIEADDNEIWALENFLKPGAQVR